MAQTDLRSAINKASHVVLGLLCLVLLVEKSNAFQFTVGGSNGWAPPSDPNSNSHNEWAEKNRFQIGDSLLFEYSGSNDSVLYVNKDDYSNCNTDNPIQKFTDGYTVFKLEHSGPHYFISGVRDNCLKNEKLVVVVLADRSKHAPPPSNGTAAAPPPSPSPSPSGPSPSPPPSAETPPSPPPTSEESPSPSSGPVQTNPTPAPSQESSPPHKNGASSIVVTSCIATLGAFAGSSFLLIF